MLQCPNLQLQGADFLLYLILCSLAIYNGFINRFEEDGLKGNLIHQLSNLYAQGLRAVRQRLWHRWIGKHIRRLDVATNEQGSAGERFDAGIFDERLRGNSDIQLKLMMLLASGFITAHW